MKKILLASALLFGGVALNAQTAKPATTKTITDEDLAKKATEQTAKIDKAITLSADQKTKAQAINLDYNKRIAMAISQLTGEALSTKKKQINAKRIEDLDKIITPEQEDKWTKFKADFVPGGGK